MPPLLDRFYGVPYSHVIIQLEEGEREEEKEGGRD